MLKARKSHIIDSCAILAILFINYLRGQKYDAVQKFHWLFCVGSLNSWHCE